MAKTTQGITPTFTFTLEDDTIDLTQTTNVYVTFRQFGNTLTKEGADVTVGEKTCDVYLSQAETLSFAKGNVEVKLNWVYEDGSRGCSDTANILWEENLLKEVLP